MSSPSISVMNCGKEFSLASALRHSCWVPQCCARACIVASCTPCVASETVSRSGHLVALTRLFRSVICASGTFTLNGRRSTWSLVRVSTMASNLLEKVPKPREAAATVAAAALKKRRRFISGVCDMRSLQGQRLTLPLPQRFERRAQLGSGELRLLPRGEVSTLGGLVEVNQVLIGTADP